MVPRPAWPSAMEAAHRKRIQTDKTFCTVLRNASLLFMNSLPYRSHKAMFYGSGVVMHYIPIRRFWENVARKIVY
jgi:hypothetical protein